MGRAYRKQVIGILNLLKKMQEGVQKAIRCQNIQSAEQILIQIQDASITLGTSIEAHIGEDSDTVRAVEEYCELIYQLYEVLGQQGELEMMQDAICSQWQKIQNCAEEELSNRYEIVFLPYKVSMWDSLESVWIAAVEDPDCDAYVIPIPYYDKNADGTFRSEHYEGEAFPAGVPITNYLEYDFENRHPDAIFIHNPYDDHNFVTSVHPYFYTQNLRKFTERLVYIPYYISAETNPDSLDVIEGKAGMTLTNGVLNSDMVFLQSENTKRLFVNILERYVQNTDRNYWENRIWGLGSPKLDRVNRVVRDDARLPQDWHDMIYTESGLRKKVIFYNISISTLLNNPDMLNKIRDVLCYFKNSKDAVLWWRPHPLYESTLASMRPDMLSEYQQIVNQYKKEAWGIFDDGVDLQWAIAETDAYYGDKSSVVQLYKEAKKPVMIQHVTVRTQHEIKAEDIPIWPSAFCADGEDIWLVHGAANILMKYSIKEKSTCVIGAIPNEVMFNGSLYKGMYKWKNKVFLIPSGAREVAVYDCIKEKFEKIPVNNIDKYDGKALFMKIYVKGKYLYCIPFVYEAILKIDMDSNHMEYIVCEKVNGTYISDTTRREDRVIAVYAYTNRAMVFDMDVDFVSYTQLGNVDRQYTKIANIGSNLYLFDSNTRCIVEMQEDNPLEEKGFWKISDETVKMTAVTADLFLLDISDRHELRMINGEGNSVFHMKEEQSMAQSSLGSPFYVGIESDSPILSDDAFYYSRTTYTMYQFVGAVLERQFSMSLEKNVLDELKKQVMHLEDMESNENDIYGLEIWLNGLKERRDLKQERRQNSGEKILQVVKETLDNGTKKVC